MRLYIPLLKKLLTGILYVFNQYMLESCENGTTAQYLVKQKENHLVCDGTALTLMLMISI